MTVEKPVEWSFRTRVWGQAGSCQAQILACAFSAMSLARALPQEKLQPFTARSRRIPAFSRCGDPVLEPNSQGLEHPALNIYQKTIIVLFSFYQSITYLLCKT